MSFHVTNIAVLWMMMLWWGSSMAFTTPVVQRKEITTTCLHVVSSKPQQETQTEEEVNVEQLWQMAGTTSRRKRRRGRKPVVLAQHMPTSIRTRNYVEDNEFATNKKTYKKKLPSSMVDLIPKEEISSVAIIVPQKENTSDQITILANVTLVNGTEWIINPQTLHQRQNEAVWLAVRKAVDVTASEFSAVLDKSIFTTRQTLMDKKLGKISTDFVGNLKACQWGLKMEPKAFRQYCDVTGNTVKQSGLHICSFPASSNGNDCGDTERLLLGASPDGLVVEEQSKDGSSVPSRGLLEIKCLWGRRNKKTEMPQWENCPNRFFDQIQGQLAICDLDWCDLMLYVPPSNRFRKNYCIIRVPRHREYWSDTMLPALQEFCQELKREQETLLVKQQQDD